MIIFFTPDISGNVHTLDETESKHCIRVLRHVKGDQLILVDGKGCRYEAIISDPNPKKCVVEVVKTIVDFEKRDYYLHIAIAPTKNIDRFEWFLEKATEIGIDEITPLLCEHSERKQINVDRLEKVLVTAMKQSLKAFKPKLNNLTKFETFIESTTSEFKFIAHCAEGDKQNLFYIAKPATSTLVLIGPEGDFSLVEIEAALKNNFKEISLGKSRLRTETAGIVATQLINTLNDQ